MPDNLTWDSSTRRYLHPDGSPVTQVELRQVVEAIAGDTQADLRALGASFQAGEINLAEWALQADALVKNELTTIGVLVRGGVDQMTPREWGRVANEVKAQKKFLREFVLEVENGEYDITGGRFLQRLGMYAESGIASFENTVRRRELDLGEYDEEMRVLGSNNSCVDCPGLAGHWEPIGTLPAIGATTCVVNCRCSFRYRNSETGAESV